MAGPRPTQEEPLTLRSETADTRAEVEALRGEVEALRDADRAHAEERDLFLGGPVVFARWGGADGTHLEYLSPNVEALTGVSASDLCSGAISFLDLLHASDRAAFLEGRGDAGAGAGFLEREYRLIRRDGRTVWVREFGRPVERGGRRVGTHSYLLDNTERARSEGELRETKEKLEYILGITKTSVDIIDPEYRLRYVDPQWQRIYGDFKGRCCYEYFMGRTEPCPTCGIPQAMRTRQITVTEEVLPREGDRVVEVHTIPFQDAEGRWLVAEFNVDVTDRRRMEERLRQTEKMEAIGQLAGGVAHDFNNQLAGIMGYAELLTQRLQDPKLHRYAEGILTTAHRAADLTQQLLAFARKGRYRPCVVNLHAVVTEVVMLLERSIDPRIHVRLNLNANPHCVVGDLTQVQNAVLNLALNARDAMPAGGELGFSTSVLDLDEAGAKARIPFDLAPGRYVQLSVRDTGVGMDGETLGHLYEPFFTTKGVGKGTGMGLAAVYGTVRSHRGAIEVQSEPGEGTTFRLVLPVPEGPVGEAHEEPLPVPTLDRGARILVVDDEHDVRNLLTELLRHAGHEVICCLDGEEAVALFERAWREIDLVVMDLVMPRLGGLELFEALRRIDPGARVLISSGYSVDGQAQAILDRGALGFLQKPFRNSDLRRAIVEALRASGR